ncbi:copper resistance CopC family protein [Micromonospora sp. NBC_01813]|uniref:copper resistance CopC family protein n=1 Tax=Micromonospora sp. NBC_01813 TaxID=2975988 RepID=UPI002DD8903C|nr:copper resistance CopC family protein [Micromonospora sp. NBC_01813]WSA10817.1 copper resistance protein CopC [Micromonospora sp. NBC_01813]
MNTTHPTRRRVATALAALGAAAAAVLTIGSPAHAHDQVIEQFPKADAQLPEAPDRISLTFTSPVLDIGAIMMVVDPSGKNWATGDATITDAAVVQPLPEDMADGNYQVRWRVVSGDGHPLSESFLFSVGDVTGAPTFPEPASGAEPTDGLDNANQGEFALTGAIDDTTQSQQAVPRAALFGFGGTVLGLLLFTIGRSAAGRPGRRSRPDLKGTTP